MKIKIANKIATYGTPRFAASHLGLFCLPMSHKMDARLIWVETASETKREDKQGTQYTDTGAN